RAQPAAGELRALNIVKNIHHPNLLVIFGTWHVGEHLVIAMELADRSVWDLFTERTKKGRPGIDADELLDCMDEAAKGIDYLNAYQHSVDGHEAVGVQHRDIKPQNILLVGGGVKVADF